MKRKLVETGNVRLSKNILKNFKKFEERNMNRSEKSSNSSWTFFKNKLKRRKNDSKRKNNNDLKRKRNLKCCLKLKKKLSERLLKD